MTSYATARSGRQAGTAQPAHLAPHAALLIDFDNVTLGIRSDLTKELRTLLNSDIIKGKVAVQRAYADWRRYPQYIVPLSESSIDLIFAPAFGTNKKNATDIRLAVDAIELVFTRPEIGTFILLSGDSDFSSLVIKLKEYGKYVIGVGIRESASDLLIQNCDEYFSYSDLAGLTKEADVPSIQRDAWELVVEAVERMARDNDVMRSDRLKQVMQQIDTNFEEKNVGFNRFSKFVTEAGNRGLIKVTKLDNGQFEVAPVTGGTATAAPAPRARVEPAAPATMEGEENGRRRRGRRGGRGRDRDRDRGERPQAPPAAPARAEGPLTLAESFDLLQRALGELSAPAPHDKVRARMVALLGREDPLLEAGRFNRLLRQANDAEVADVRKLGADAYEVSPHRTQRLAQAKVAASSPAAERAPGARDRSRDRGHPAPDSVPAEPAMAAPTDVEAAAPEPAAPSGGDSRRAPATLRFRRGSRGPTRSAEVPLVGVVRMEPEVPAEPAKPSRKPAKPRARGKGAKAPKAEAPKAEAKAEVKATATPAVPGPARRGSRGRGRAKAKAAKGAPAE